MQPTRSRASLVLVILLAAASAAALLSSQPSFGRAVWSDGSALALAVAWSVALAASVWLLTTTTACLVAIGCRRPQLAHGLARTLPLGIRRLVEIAIVASCLSVPALPAHAANPGSGLVVDQPVVRAPHALAIPTTPTAPVGLQTPHTATTPRSTVTPHTATAPPSESNLGEAPAQSPSSTSPAPDPPVHARSGSHPRPHDVPAAPTPGVPTAGARRVVVRPGDNLWVIARAALFDASRTLPDDHDVARYWTLVIAANRSTLRSGDPSLIFPGEVVTLPPVPAVS